VQSIAVAYSDRFGRTLLDGLQAVRDLEQLGCKLVAVNDGWDARRDDSPIYFQFRMMFAEEEHRRISQRMADGKLRAMNRDNAPPGGPLTFGYRVDQQGRYVMDPDEAPLVIRAFQMILEGHSQQDILAYCKASGVPAGRRFQKRTAGSLPTVCKTHISAGWHTSKITRMLRNRVYLGERRWGNRIFPCTPLVDPDTFNRVQEILRNTASRRQGGHRRIDLGLLSGLFTCGTCGRPYYRKRTSFHRKNGRTNVYQMYACVGRHHTPQCRSKMVPVGFLDGQVWALIEEYLSDPEVLVRKVLAADQKLGTTVGDFDRQEGEYLAALESLEAVVRSVWDEQRAHKWPMAWVAPRLDELNDRREKITRELSEIRRARLVVLVDREQSGQVAAALAGIRSRLKKGLSPQEKSEIIRLIVAGGVVRTIGSGKAMSAEVAVQLRWGELVRADTIASRVFPKY
jgi:hypothetical protein